MIWALASCLTVAVLVEPVRRFAIWQGAVDRPRADRVHRQATPYLGGLAIVTGALVTIPFTGAGEDRQVPAIVIGGLLLATLGAVDDLRPLSALARLITELFVATAVALSGVRIELFGGYLDVAITALWVVLLTNAFNLLDNSDAVAGTVAFATAMVLAGAAMIVGRPGLGAFLLAVSAAAAGFLVHNWPPARIFMGDCGSLFLGFTLATSAICVGATAPIPAELATLLLTTFAATVEVGVVIVARQRAGRSWLLGGRDHVAHRMIGLGLGRGQTAVLFGSCTALCGVLGALTLRGDVPGLVSLALALLTGAALVVVLQWAPHPDAASQAAARSPAVGEALAAGEPRAAAEPLSGAEQHENAPIVQPETV